MKISPYLKALLYVLLFLFFYMFIMASTSIFITHSEQPAVFGVFTSFFILSTALILVGLLQVRRARLNGEPKSWYQQYEVSLGLSLLCFLFIFIEIGVFDILPKTLLLLKIENGTLLLVSLLSAFFLLLSIKYKPTYDDGKPQERMLASLRNLRATVPVGSAEYEDLSNTIRSLEQKQSKADEQNKEE